MRRTHLSLDPLHALVATTRDRHCRLPFAFPLQLTLSAHISLSTVRPQVGWGTEGYTGNILHRGHLSFIC